MFTPFDTAHLTQRAERHIPADKVTRDANRALRAKRRAAWRSFVAEVFASAPRSGAVVKPVNWRA